MQLKLRNVLSAFAVVTMMSVATSAFAQVTFIVSSTPTSRARNNGHTELAGDVTFTVSSAGTPAGGSVTVDYGGIQITNAQTGGPASAPALGSDIEVIGSGCFAGAVAADGAFPAAFDNATDADVAVNNAAGTIVLTLQGGGACGVGDNVQIRNVHVSVAGSGQTSLGANISAAPGSGYLITAGQNTPTVISSIQDPLVDANLSLSPGTTPAVTLSNGLVPPGAGGFSIRLRENFFDAFLDSTELGLQALNDVQVTLTFAGLPSGVTLTGLVATDNVNGNGAGGGLALSNTTVNSTTATSTTITYGAGLLATNAIDTITITGAVTVGGGATLPLTPGAVTVTANVTPTGSAFGGGGAVIAPAAGNFPRYASDPTATVTIANIVSAQTNLLIPFATSSQGFDSGISVANTTTDPFAAPNSAIPQNGTITFDFFPQTGSTFSYTTSATSPGLGLTSGVLNSGGTYAVLLSELLAASGASSDFSGYIIITANFTNGHGNIFLTDFAGFTAGGDVLVIPPPATGLPRTVVFGEALGK